jgi:acetyl-CoA acetyltransferase
VRAQVTTQHKQQLADRDEENVYRAQRPAISKVFVHAENNAQENPNAGICAPCPMPCATNNLDINPSSWPWIQATTHVHLDEVKCIIPGHGNRMTKIQTSQTSRGAAVLKEGIPAHKVSMINRT